MNTIPIYINVIQAGSSADEALDVIDLEVSHSGEIQEVYVSGVRVDGQIDVIEFITLLIGQSNLLKMAEAARSKTIPDRNNEPQP